MLLLMIDQREEAHKTLSQWWVGWREKGMKREERRKGGTGGEEGGKNREGRRGRERRRKGK